MQHIAENATGMPGSFAHRADPALTGTTPACSPIPAGPITHRPSPIPVKYAAAMPRADLVRPRASCERAAAMRSIVFHPKNCQPISCCISCYTAPEMVMRRKPGSIRLTSGHLLQFGCNKCPISFSLSAVIRLCFPLETPDASKDLKLATQPFRNISADSSSRRRGFGIQRGDGSLILLLQRLS